MPWRPRQAARRARHGARRSPGRGSRAGRGRAPRARRGARCRRAHRRRRGPSTNAVDGLRVGKPEQVADAPLVDGVVGRRESSWSSIDSASRMPPAARRAIRCDGFRRRRSGRPASRIRRELALDLGDGQAPDVVALEARQDRRREAWRLGRGEHEVDEVGRLLERLQEGVPGVLRDLVGLVEDVDLASEVGRARSRSARAGRGWRRSRGSTPRRSRPGRAPGPRGSRRTTGRRRRRRRPGGSCS